MAKDVKEISVIARWGSLVVGQAAKADEFVRLVQHDLKQCGWPHPVQLVEMGTGSIGSRKPYLETKGPEGKLVAYVGAETIGHDLYLSWCLTLDDPALIKRAAAAGDGFATTIFQEVSFNQVNRAQAFASSLHRFVQKAVDTLLDEAGVDKGQVDREVWGLLRKVR